MCVVLSLVAMILKILWERGQNRAGPKRKEVAKLNQSIPLMISGYWNKDILFLEERFCICVNRKEEKALDLFQSDMDQI